MPLPNPGMDFTPFDTLPAASLDDMVENIESLADGSGFDDGALRDALGIGDASFAGWDLLGNTPNTVTANGNRSYTCVFNSVDLTGTISPGMRLRTSRTVAAPTQSTSLNGTSQYYSKSSPAGMTFTNNFVVSAWVKLTSYPATQATITSRYNGTSGWSFDVNSSGQLRLLGYNGGAANIGWITSYQSVPLNKWVHVTAQLDMTSTTNSPTVNYTMIDGVDVPAFFSRGGTNPTALIQAGNLEIGSKNATPDFPGKIAQVAIYSAKVTQATVRASMNQTLSGSETNLISAYSFNNTINDLNTTNANNLTANGSAVATNADSPFGTQASGLISSTLDYAIVQSATFSTNTTVVVQVPEGCTIPTSGGVSAVSYSTQKAPYGFPAPETKWTVDWYLRTAILFGAGNTNNTYQSGPTNGSFAITAPVGEWNGRYDVCHYVDRGTSVTLQLTITLSTSNSGSSDDNWTVTNRVGGGSGSTYNGVQQVRSGYLSVSSATPYYLAGFATSSDAVVGNHGLNSVGGTSLISLKNAYL